MREPRTERAVQGFVARSGLECSSDAPAVRMPDEEHVRYLEDLHSELDCGRCARVVRGELAVVGCRLARAGAGGGDGATHFPMLRWTKMSPGTEAVITDSGTRESEQPSQRI